MSDTRILVHLLQKGGVSKSTTSAITAHLLAEKGYKVLCVDMDSQGNLSSLIGTAENIYEYRGNTVLEAMQECVYVDGEELFEKYVQQPRENLHLIPAEDLLATFPRWVYTEFIHDRKVKEQEIHPGLILKTLLDKIIEYRKYDFCVIDCPPALGDLTINALGAATDLIGMFEPSRFAFDALPTLYETYNIVKESLNPRLNSLGILCTIIDARRTDAKMFLEALQNSEFYGPLLFNTIIHRKAATGRISLYGFEDNSELETGLEDYRLYVEELLSRL